MALICSTRCLKCSHSLIFLRLLNHERFLQKSSQFSTSKLLGTKSQLPVKYTTNKASKVPIAETIGFTKVPEKKREPGDYRLYIIWTSFIVFLIYFGILREENDIDEMLKGNPDIPNVSMELWELKVKLKYCQQNKLPTDAIRARIEELEKDKKIASPFLK